VQLTINAPNASGAAMAFSPLGAADDKMKAPDGTPQLTLTDGGEVARDELLGDCGSSRGKRPCEPLYRYDVVKVYSPPVVDELLQDERNKALADVNWWYRRELKRLTMERTSLAAEPTKIGEADGKVGQGNPFEDPKIHKGDPVAPRMFPMERHGYSIFGGVFQPSADEPPAEARALPQISDSLWPKHGTFGWGPLGSVNAGAHGEHQSLLGDQPHPAPTYDSRGHPVPWDNRRHRVVSVQSMWETVPQNRMPSVPLPHFHFPQARAFEAKQLDEPWSEQKLKPLKDEGKKQYEASKAYEAKQDEESQKLAAVSVEGTSRERDKAFDRWHEQHAIT